MKYKNLDTASELDPFYNMQNQINLNIQGLMVIPPNDNTLKNILNLNELSKTLALKTSMGMSADYVEAIKHGATFIRVGSSIFGERS